MFFSYFQDLLLSCYFKPHRTEKTVWYIGFLQAKLCYLCRKFGFRAVMAFVLLWWLLLALANTVFSWQNLMSVNIGEIWWKSINPLNSSCLTMKKAWKSGSKFWLWLLHHTNHIKMISCNLLLEMAWSCIFAWSRRPLGRLQEKTF